jgi:TatD DNase family protein
MAESKNKYIDAHLHLLDKRIAARAADIIRESQEAGVEALFCNATTENNWTDVLRLGKADITVYPFLGIHPWYIDSLSPNRLDSLAALLRNSRAGIGEVGLDKTRDNFTLQAVILQKQLKLAETLHRPVAIHCVRAWGRLLEILADIDLSAFKFLVHGFNGSLEVMQQLVKLGAFVSFSTMLAHPARERLRQVFIRTPLDHIFLETDAPDQFCEIVSYNGNSSEYFSEKKLNHPLAVIKLYEYAARLRGMNVRDFAEILWNNGTIFTH